MKVKAKGKKAMGRFLVEIEVINNSDLGLAKQGFLDPAKVRRKMIQGVVDTGATRMVLPQAVVEELGLPIKQKKVRVRHADGRRGFRSEADEVRLQLMGRDGIFTAVVEPKRDTALIGASCLDRLSIYAALKIPEVWRLSGGTLAFLILDQGGNYAEGESLSFPFLKSGDLLNFLAMYDQVAEVALVRKFREWVRQRIADGWK